MGKNLGILAVLVLVIAVMAYMLGSIGSKKGEQVALNTPEPVVAEGVESRSEKWRAVYPRQYDSWKKTKENAKIDDMIEKYPQLAILWAGYGFAKDYNAPRGHMYALESNINTLRTGAPTGPSDGPMPTACWTCKSTDVGRIIKRDGELEYFTGKWSRYGEEIVNPIGCADCHNSQTGQLEFSRPYTERAIVASGRKLEDLTHQDMRSLVCAQCHSEYYFRKTPYTDKDGNEKTAAVVTFPWAKGLSAEAMEEFYNEYNFKDWTNKISKAPMLKAQHPGYEIATTGAHAKQGLSCADCHMPYHQEGGVKFSNHQIRSPLDDIANSCLTCHRQSEEEFKATVEEKLARKDQLHVMAMNSLAVAHLTAKKAWEVGATEGEMTPVLEMIRSSQWHWDYSIASHGSFFHAPEETLRLLAVANEKAQQANLDLVTILARYGVLDYEVPDFSTKEKAQKLAGLDMDKLVDDKKRFRQGLRQEWDEKATDSGLLNKDAWKKDMPDNASYLQ